MTARRKPQTDYDEDDAAIADVTSSRWLTPALAETAMAARRSSVLETLAGNPHCPPGVLARLASSR